MVMIMATIMTMIICNDATDKKRFDEKDKSNDDDTNDNNGSKLDCHHLQDQYVIDHLHTITLSN